MAYLGISNIPGYEGLYEFMAISKRDEVAEILEGSIRYSNQEKRKALRDFSLESSEIKDGRILMDYLRDNKLDRSYLVITGTPWEGAYFFKQRVIRDREAEKFEDVFVTNNKDEVLNKFGIKESDIRNGGIILKEDVQNWLKKQARKKENLRIEAERKKAKEEKLKAKAEEQSIISTENGVKNETPIEVASDKIVEKVVTSEKETHKEVKVLAPEKPRNTSVGNVLRNMIDVVQSYSDVVEILMANGEKYRVALRTIFYTENDFSFANCAYTDASNNVILKESLINKYVDNGDITIVSPSKIKYGEGYAILRDCDDAYSPTVVFDKQGRKNIVHEISEIVINVEQVISVVGCEGYTELNMTKIVADKQKMIFDYLYSKYRPKK